MKRLFGIGIILALVASMAFGGETRPSPRDNGISISGMAKTWLADGRIVYGAVTGNYDRVRAGIGVIENVSLEVIAEPSLARFQGESSFNFEQARTVEIGIYGRVLDASTPVLMIIIPQWGSIAIVPTKKLTSSEWTVSEKTVTITGTETGFTVNIQ
jgi:hypothetical protein